MKVRLLPVALAAALAAFQVSTLRAQVSLPPLTGYTFTTIAAPAAVSGQNIQIRGVNDAGDFVLVAYTSGDSARSFVYRNGTYSEISIPGYAATVAYGINNAGTITGGVGVPSTSALQAFTYAAGTGATAILGSPSGEPNFGADDLSQNGLIVGRSHLASNYDRAFLYSAGNFTPITIPGTSYVYASGVNDSSAVTGYYYSGGRFYGYLWSGGSHTVLDIPGAASVNPEGINNAGQIVGTYNFGTGGTLNAGFVYSGSTYYDVQYPGAHKTWITGINAAGDLVGFVQLTETGPFIGIYGTAASAIPEPAEWTALLAAAALAGAVWRRRFACA